MKKFICLIIISLTIYLPVFSKDPDISKFKEVAHKIIEAAMKDTVAYYRLGYMCDTYGSRISGSRSLNYAIYWSWDRMRDDGFKNSHIEEVQVPHWVRGNESCELISPRNKKINMLGLGGSINTPPDGIKAQVLVVGSYDELKQRANEAKGKIILYDFKWEGYGKDFDFRYKGADEAAKVGAVASLIRSLSPIGMNLPHTGVMSYDDSIPKIPAAAISVEDADMLKRMQERGQQPWIKLYMEAQTLPDTTSYNLICELKGTQKPEDIIAFGGHIDSWDVGSGAQDDGGGVYTSYGALKILKDLGIQTKKTLRVVFWVNEENGTHGGKDYAAHHSNEPHALMLEFDSGTFPPSSLGFTGPDEIYNKLKQYEPLFQEIDSIKIIKGGGGTDIGPMMKTGVPGIGLGTKDEGKYFWYHHSDSDTFDKIDLTNFRKCEAAIALAVYIYSEM